MKRFTASAIPVSLSEGIIYMDTLVVMIRAIKGFMCFVRGDVK